MHNSTRREEETRSTLLKFSNGDREIEKRAKGRQNISAVDQKKKISATKINI